MVDWNIAALVGVPGVGKTSLSKSLARARGYRHVNYGELMLEVAMSKGLASNQDEMFELKFEVQESIWKEAGFRVKKLAESSTKILMDLHGVDGSKMGYLISLPIEIVSPDIIVVVESSYENIVNRRISDITRNRHVEDLQSVFEHMNILRLSMMACSVICNAYMSVVDNDDFNTCLDELDYVLSSQNSINNK